MDPRIKYIQQLLTPEAREEKQPTWVRDKLNDLRRELLREQQANAELREVTDPAGSLVLLDVHSEPIGLGNATVYFRTAPADDPLDALYVQVDPKRRVITATCESNYLHIRPVCGNSVELHTDDPRK